MPERQSADTSATFRIESTLPTWIKSFYSTIDPLFPASPDFVPLSADILPPPRINLTPVTHMNCNGNGTAKLTGSSSTTGGSWAPDTRWAKVMNLERSTRADWYQDVQGLELEFEGGVS